VSRKASRTVNPTLRPDGEAALYRRCSPTRILPSSSHYPLVQITSNGAVSPYCHFPLPALAQIQYPNLFAIITIGMRWAL
jgi:hypothetical protein